MRHKEKERMIHKKKERKRKKEKERMRHKKKERKRKKEKELYTCKAWVAQLVLI